MPRGKHHDLLWTPSPSPAPLGEAAVEIHARELPPRCPTPLQEAWAWKHACLGRGGCGGSAGGMEPEFPLLLFGSSSTAPAAVPNPARESIPG